MRFRFHIATHPNTSPLYHHRMKTHTLRIVGMTCAGCAARVRSALQGVAGVGEAGVNLMTESAAVQADERVTAAALIDAVRAAGYDAEPLAAAAATGDDAAHRDAQRRQRQALVQAVGLALPILALDHFGHSLQASHHAGMLGWRMLQGALMVMLLISPAGGPLLAGGLRAALHRTANMDLLVSLGVVTAVASSLYGTFTLQEGYIHYHAAAMIVALVCLGRHLEALAKRRAGSAMAALARRAPKTALVRREDQFVSRSVDEITIGDEVRLVPHAAVPTDGEISDGQVAVDESLLTGEPLPQTRGVGEAVRAGTLVVEGTCVYRATHVGSASTLGRIAELVNRAQSTRTPMQRVADRMAAWLTPVVAAAALLTLAGWLAHGGRAALPDGLRCAIAVLVVACPCAMGLATPTAVFVASGQAALRGILVRDAATLEAMARVRTVVWDKTGTLTLGRPRVVSIALARAADVVGSAADSGRDAGLRSGAERADPSGEDADEMLRLAACAERLSVHPLAQAVVDEAHRRGLEVPMPEDFRSVVGAGVQATVEGRSVLVGKLDFLRREGVHVDAVGAAGAGMSVAVAIDGRLAGTLTIDDPVRPLVVDVVVWLRYVQTACVMLTGDAVANAQRVAAEVGIAEWHADADPAGKVRVVEQLKASRGPVAMVGDGVNDAAALAAADVGIAFATGADVAAAAAGINLIGSTPHLVADALFLARRALRIMRENLFWAVAYNAVMLPLAAVGRLPPAWAAAAMMGSSLTVVLNALRIGHRARVASRREPEDASRRV